MAAKDLQAVVEALKGDRNAVAALAKVVHGRKHVLPDGTRAALCPRCASPLLLTADHVHGDEDCPRCGEQVMWSTGLIRRVVDKATGEPAIVMVKGLDAKHPEVEHRVDVGRYLAPKGHHEATDARQAHGHPDHEWDMHPQIEAVGHDLVAKGGHEWITEPRGWMIDVRPRGAAMFKDRHGREVHRRELPDGSLELSVQGCRRTFRRGAWPSEAYLRGDFDSHWPEGVTPEELPPVVTAPDTMGALLARLAAAEAEIVELKKKPKVP